MVGAIAFGFFVTAMTVGRLVGGSLLERFGRVPVLRATAVIALAGLLLVLFGGSTPVALAGALLWGVGASLGFPVGMSAAADDPARAAARVSVVSSIGYTAFLAGPPLIGLLGRARRHPAGAARRARRAGAGPARIGRGPPAAGGVGRCSRSA